MFCCICGKLTLNPQKITIPTIKKAYELYFGYKSSDRTKTGLLNVWYGSLKTFPNMWNHQTLLDGHKEEWRKFVEGTEKTACE
jgi:hypothetical protein